LRAASLYRAKIAGLANHPKNSILDVKVSEAIPYCIVEKVFACFSGSVAPNGDAIRVHSLRLFPLLEQLKERSGGNVIDVCLEC
jgi:hypothetical protein